VKAKANKLTMKHLRLIADGNELFRFLCTTVFCLMGINGALCNSIANCHVGNIIKSGFKIEGTGGIHTTASSGRAHGSVKTRSNEKTNRLVYRVIAERIKNREATGEVIPCSRYDSVADQAGTYPKIG
jgi:hypothetical protein